MKGILRGVDDTTNLLVDKASEFVRNTENVPTERLRELGLIFVKSTSVGLPLHKLSHTFTHFHALAHTLTQAHTIALSVGCHDIAHA